LPYYIRGTWRNRKGRRDRETASNLAANRLAQIASEVERVIGRVFGADDGVERQGEYRWLNDNPRSTVIAAATATARRAPGRSIYDPQETPDSRRVPADPFRF
jgi:hypothetical protein